jgi:DNA-binding transcriptional ArsR family regulator
MFDFMNITKALADENRIRILMALDGRDELCVCQLIDLLQLAPSTVSKHLFILRNARLVRGRKQGRWMYYRLNRDEAAAMVKEALEWVSRSVGAAPVIREDQDRLAPSDPSTGIRCGA